MLQQNPLVAFYIRSCLAGFALAGVFTSGLVYLDVARIGYLVSHVEGGWLALFLLWFFNAIVFSGAQAAVAVLLMAEKEDEGDKGGGSAPEYAVLPIPVQDRR